MHRFLARPPGVATILLAAHLVAAPGFAASPMDILSGRGVVDNCRGPAGGGHAGPFTELCGNCQTGSFMGFARTLSASCLTDANGVRVSTLWTDFCDAGTIAVSDGWLICECKPGKRLIWSPVNGRMCG